MVEKWPNKKPNKKRWYSNSFFAGSLDDNQLYLLVLGVFPLCLYHCCTPSRHTGYQILHHLLWYLIPFLFNPIPKLMYFSRWFFIVIKLSLEVIPNIFNGIEVWGLCWPYKYPKIIVLKPPFGQFWGVLRVIALLEVDIFYLVIIILQGFEELIPKDLCVKVSLHPTINPGSI